MLALLPVIDAYDRYPKELELTEEARTTAAKIVKSLSDVTESVMLNFMTKKQILENESAKSTKHIEEEEEEDTAGLVGGGKGSSGAFSSLIEKGDGSGDSGAGVISGEITVDSVAAESREALASFTWNSVLGESCDPQVCVFFCWD